MQRHPEASTLAAAVIGWQKQHGRHALPWQNTRDAYRIWLSEIMLQQTQVTAVVGYYARFLARFPTVQALAQASQEEVLGLWSGLGYYTRARNLHRCAIEVVGRFGGVFPSDPALLSSLPGIGRSTAAAIAAFAFDHSSPILDGNVKRVFCRVFAVDGPPGKSTVDRYLWEIAERETPATDIVAYTQGLMDLGATVCTRSRPACESCPLQSRCQAYERKEQSLYPRTKIKAPIPTRSLSWLIVGKTQSTDNKAISAVLLVKRGAGAVWEGLWAFPEVCAELDLLARAERGSVIEHQFSHYRLLATPFVLRAHPETVLNANDGADWLKADEQMLWMPREQWANAALPAPIKKFLLRLNSPLN